MAPIPSRDSLQGALRTEFRFESLDGRPGFVLLELIEVSVRKAPAGYEQFSMLFAGPESPVAGQGTYRVTHETLGEFDLFTVPVGAGPQRQYEASVSRRIGV